MRRISKERLRKLYDITDWGIKEVLILLDSGAPLKNREMFWNEYHERLIMWALNLEETTNGRRPNKDYIKGR